MTQQTHQAIAGSLLGACGTPGHDITTSRHQLARDQPEEFKHYQLEYKTIIPETRIGYDGSEVHSRM